MSLNSNAIAVQGIGYSPLLVALQGFASASDNLIGKRPRRGRSRPRFEEIVERVNDGEIDLLSQEYTEQIIEQAKQIARSKTDLEIARKSLKSGEEKIQRLNVLEASVVEAEDRMKQLKDEEDFIIILALAL